MSPMQHIRFIDLFFMWRTRIAYEPKASFTQMLTFSETKLLLALLTFILVFLIAGWLS